MSFKESVADDNMRVFINLDEFAERRHVKYDGVTYRDVPMVLSHVKQKDRPLIVGNANHMQGLHVITETAHIALEDLQGVVPENGRYMSISDGFAANAEFFQRYKVHTCDLEMGMLIIGLEAYDE